MSKIVFVSGRELKTSKSRKFINKLMDEYSVNHVLDHVETYKKVKDDRLVVISHAYGFGLDIEDLENFEELLNDDIEIVIGPGMDESTRYSNGTVPIMFIDHPKKEKK